MLLKSMGSHIGEPICIGDLLPVHCLPGIYQSMRLRMCASSELWVSSKVGSPEIVEGGGPLVQYSNAPSQVC